MQYDGWIGKAVQAINQYMPFIAMAMWGGTVNYISKLRSGESKFSFVVLAGEWSTSGFAGLLAGLVCVKMGMSWESSMFVVGMAGHASARTLFLLQKTYEKWLGNADIGGKK